MAREAVGREPGLSDGRANAIVALSIVAMSIVAMSIVVTSIVVTSIVVSDHVERS